MKFDMELEDILYSMKNKDKDEKTEEKATDTAADAAGEAPQELAPPKPKTEMNADPEELVWFDGKDAPKADETPEKKKEPFLAKLKARLTKRNLIIIGAVLLAVLFVFCGIKAAQAIKASSLKKYETQYGVTYPEGIQRKYLDLYGQNSTFAGTLTIGDTDTEIAVYGKPGAEDAQMEKGSNVLTEQHYRAVALTKAQADLESVYATAEGYVQSSQTVTFDMLTGKETYHVIAAYYTNTKPEDDNGYVFPYNCYGNFTEKSFYHYQDRIKTRSLYDTGHLIQPEDHCLTVSVDSDIMPDFRFVIVGVRAEKGRVSHTDETADNPMIHYPQALCDQKGIHNTYHLAGHWYPEIYTDEAQTQTKQLTIDDFTE